PRISAVKPELHHVLLRDDRRLNQQVIIGVVLKTKIEVGRVNCRVHADALARLIIADPVAMRVPFENGETCVKRRRTRGGTHLTDAAPNTRNRPPPDDDAAGNVALFRRNIADVAIERENLAGTDDDAVETA